MERVLVSRQPIFRTDMAVMGYELLFRDGDTDSASIFDGARAVGGGVNKLELKPK